jgi:hypothetical protein
LKLAELITLELADGTTYRYTTHQTDIVWDLAGNTYSAAVPISPGSVSSKHTGEFDDYEFSLGHLNTPFSPWLIGSILENVKVTIKRVRWDTSYSSAEELTVFVGYANVRFDRQTVSLTCRPVINSLNIKVPRHSFQEPCNYALFESGCTLTQSSYGYNGTATGGSVAALTDTTRGACYKAPFDAATGTVARAETITGGSGGGTAKVVQVVYLTASTGFLWYVQLAGTQFVNNEVVANGADNVTLSATPAEDTTFYALGELAITSGPNNGQRRQVHSDSGGLTVPTWAWSQAILPGTTYTIYPGCDGLATTCRDKFDNTANFRGFPYIPRIEDMSANYIEI